MSIASKGFPALFNNITDNVCLFVSRVRLGVASDMSVFAVVPMVVTPLYKPPCGDLVYGVRP